MVLRCIVFLKAGIRSIKNIFSAMLKTRQERGTATLLRDHGKSGTLAVRLKSR